MKIWICGKFGIWNWIDVVLTIDSLSVVRATLPLPDIFVGRELSEANQVGTAIALMVEFTSSLIEDELEESIIIGKVTAPYIRCSGTLSDEIDPVDGSLLARGDDRRVAGIRATIPIIPAGSLDTSHTLCILQIDFRQAEEWIVGLGTIIGCIGSICAIVLFIGPLL